MTILDRAKFVSLFFRLVQDPGRTELIFKAIDVLTKDRNDPNVIKILAQVYENQEFARLHEEKYTGDLPTLEELSTYPEGSFGRLYYNHMKSNNLTQDLFPKLDPTDSLDYVNLRMYQDHDLWHALLGYGISVEDELAVQAFSAAQLKTPFSVMLIAGGLLHLLKSDPLRTIVAIKEIADGFALGENAPFLLGFKLNEMLKKPIGDVREICGISIAQQKSA